jgi:hypothetical protein
MFDRLYAMHKLQDSVKVRFPWVAYLYQPLTHPNPKVNLILNPIKFKKLYRIWLLELCLTREVATKKCNK